MRTKGGNARGFHTLPPRFRRDGRRPRHRLSSSAGPRGSTRRREGALCPERLDPDRYRRDRHAHARPVRDGSGLADWPRDDPRRGARSRLVGGASRPDAGESRRLVAHDANRRQQRDPGLVGAAPQGGRRGARDAATGGSGDLGGGQGRVPRREGRRGARRVGPAIVVRTARHPCRGAPSAPPERRPAQGSQRLPSAGHARAPARHAGQSRRQRGVRDRRESPGDADRLDRAVAGAGRKDQKGERRWGQGSPRRASCGRAGGQLLDGTGWRLGGRVRSGRRGGRGHILASGGGAARAADRLGRGRRRGARLPECALAARGARRATGGRGADDRRRRGGAGRRSEARRGHLRRAVRAPRDHGADELHRACAARWCGRLGADPEPGRRAKGRRPGLRAAGGPDPDPHDPVGRRIRAAARAGLRLGGGSSLEGRRRAGEGHLVA